MGAQSSKAAEICGEIAARNHGVVTRSQLIAADLTRRQIAGRVRNGTLIRVHPGVYRVGHAAPSLEASYLAAVRACGERAQLSGRPAAYLWGLLRGKPPPPEVSAPTRRHVAGVVCRRRHLDPRDKTLLRGIPVTTVPLTLVDLAASLTQPDLARAFHNASVLHDTSPAEVEAVLDRRPNSPGAARLRAVLHGDERVTLSGLESRFLALLRANDLPLPLPTPDSATAASTVSGQRSGSSSSSTPTAFTARDTPGRRTAGVSASSVPAATSFAATPGAMSSKPRR
jgi:predicted transcriptional regulator of viral defense system